MIRTKHGLIILISLLALVLRVYTLDTRSLWFDELGEYYAATQDFGGMLAVIQSHLSPPLDYIIMFLMLKIFPHTDFFIRLPSLLYGIASVYMIYALAKKTFSESVGLLSAFFLAISPAAIQYSQEARMYSLFLFLSLMSFYFFTRINDGRQYYALWILSNIAMVYTHYFAVFVFLIQIVWSAAVAPPERNYRAIIMRFNGFLLVGLSFAPWFSVFIYQLENGVRNGLIPQSMSFERNLVFLLPLFLIGIAYIIEQFILIIESVSIKIRALVVSYVIIIACIAVWPSLTGYYETPKEDWKSAGQYLTANAQDNDTITVIGGLPEFVQHYTDKKLVYENPANVGDISSKWILVSTQSNRFWGTHVFNQNREKFDNRTLDMNRTEFYQIDIFETTT